MRRIGGVRGASGVERFARLAFAVALTVGVLAGFAAGHGGARLAAGSAGSAGVAPDAAAPGAVEPTLTVDAAVPQAENVTATVALPENATEARTFRVRLEAGYDEPQAVRTITLEPGDATSVDFGSCLPVGAYTVRVLAATSEVLVAQQTSVEGPANPIEFTDRDTFGFQETVRRNDTVSLDASVHECVDGATFVLRPEAGTADATTTNETDDADASSPDEVWRATVVDADDDGAVGVRWHVDAPAGEQLEPGPGDRLANVTESTSVDGYGQFDLEALVDGDTEGTGRLTVSFAAPTMTLYRVTGPTVGDGAIETVLDGTTAARNPAYFLDGEWVVVRVDTDGTLDTLPGNASLVSPDGHENVTVRFHPLRQGTSTDEPELDLANVTRRFDATTDTLWYAFRANDTVRAASIEYTVRRQTVNATAQASMTIVPPVSLGVHEGALLPPEAGVELDVQSALPEGTGLTVLVRSPDGVIARDDVTVPADGTITATVDLSVVENATDAMVVVTRHGEQLAAESVRIASEPRLTIVGFDVEELSPTSENTVAVVVENRGTANGSLDVTVTVGDATVTRTVSVEARSERRVDIRVPARGLELEERVRVVVRASDNAVSRLIEVEQLAADGTDAPLATATTTEPWPTLVGSRTPSGDSAIPGFGGLTAVGVLAAVAATGLLRARRSRTRQ